MSLLQPPLPWIPFQIPIPGLEHLPAIPWERGTLPSSQTRRRHAHTHTELRSSSSRDHHSQGVTPSLQGPSLILKPAGHGPAAPDPRKVTSLQPPRPPFHRRPFPEEPRGGSRVCGQFYLLPDPARPAACRGLCSSSRLWQRGSAPPCPAPSGVSTNPIPAWFPAPPFPPGSAFEGSGWDLIGDSRGRCGGDR